MRVRTLRLEGSFAGVVVEALQHACQDLLLLRQVSKLINTLETRMPHHQGPQLALGLLVERACTQGTQLSFKVAPQASLAQGKCSTKTEQAAECMFSEVYLSKRRRPLLNGGNEEGRM